MSFEALCSKTAFGVSQSEKRSLILSELNLLTTHHRDLCPEYKKILHGLWADQKISQASDLAEVPYLPVSLFKAVTLRSKSLVSDRGTTLTSSGTTGQTTSKIFVDSETSARQQKALTNSMSHVLGKQRLPMLVVDSNSVIKDPEMISARGAGILGMMRYGSRPTFLLDENMQLDIQGVQKFLEANGKGKFFIFGFTFLVWSQLVEKCADLGLDLSQGVLLHSGGWKKMEASRVDNSVFRQVLKDKFGLTKVHNFYGMVEQLGSIHIEGDDGLLYSPNYSNVIIRDPVTWAAAPIGTPGLVQVQSVIPRSYPGHSLLTEDMGVIETVSTEGRFLGNGFRILGRVPKAELRGCSDVIAEEVA